MSWEWDFYSPAAKGSILILAASFVPVSIFTVLRFRSDADGPSVVAAVLFVVILLPLSGMSTSVQIEVAKGDLTSRDAFFRSGFVYMFVFVLSALVVFLVNSPSTKREQTSGDGK